MYFGQIGALARDGQRARLVMDRFASRKAFEMDAAVMLVVRLPSSNCAGMLTDSHA